MNRQTGWFCGIAVFAFLISCSSQGIDGRDDLQGNPWTAGEGKADQPDDALTGDQSTSGEEARSQKERQMAPSVSTADVQSQATGNREFAFNLYQKVRTEEGNLFFSPYSISSALAMLHAGARGATEIQNAEAMRFLLPQDRLHPVLNWIDLELNSRGQGNEGSSDGSFRLNVVNSIWGQTGNSFLPDFLDRLAENYGAGLRLLDFFANPEESRQTINQWVEEQTENRIKDLLPEGAINEQMKLVLTNAIYFKATWSWRFSARYTVDSPFTLKSGSQVTVSMMRGDLCTSYLKTADYRAMILPYEGLKLSMIVLLPEEGKFDMVEQGLSQPMVDDLLAKLEPWTWVHVNLPRFNYAKPLELKKYLESMGMADAFSPAADFSGINGEHDLRVSDVLHKAFIKVDEVGTEAAAATEDSLVDGADGDFFANRPFIFFIYDHSTSTVLFLGRVLDPTK